MAARHLPPQLTTALRQARTVELAAEGGFQRRQAVAATSRLMLACVEAGWRVHELTAVLGILRNTGQARVSAARRRGDTTVGLDVPPAPRPPPRRVDQLAAPLEEREWLTVTEAARLCEVDPSSITRWRRQGLLPNTHWPSPHRPLYLRADLRRTRAAPKGRGGGINVAAALDTITTAKV